MLAFFAAVRDCFCDEGKQRVELVPEGANALVLGQQLGTMQGREVCELYFSLISRLGARARWRCYTSEKDEGNRSCRPYPFVSTSFSLPLSLYVYIFIYIPNSNAATG